MAGHSGWCSRGFTLLEALVVTALLAILAGAAVAQWASLRPALALRNATRQVVSDIHLARVLALTRHANQRVVFLAGERAYSLQRWRGNSYEEEVRRELPAGIDVSGFTMPAGAIAFRARGTAITYGSVTLRNQRAETRTLIVDAMGSVRVP